MNKKNFGVKISLFLLVILGWAVLTSTIGHSMASEFRVNQFTEFPPEEDGAEDPAVATDSNNHFIITWEDTRFGDDNVFARIFNSNGTPLGDEFRVDQDPDVASDSSIAVDNIWKPIT